MLDRFPQPLDEHIVAPSAQLQRRRLMQVHIEAVCLDSSIVKVYPDGICAPQNGPQALGRSPLSAKLHVVAADDRHGVTWSLTPGQPGDAPGGAD